MRSVCAVVMTAAVLVGLSGCNRDNDEQDDRCSCNCSHDRGSIIGRSDCVPAPAPMAAAMIPSNTGPSKSTPIPAPVVARIEKPVSAPVPVQPMAPAKIEEVAKIQDVVPVTPTMAVSTQSPVRVPVSSDSHYVRSEPRHVNAITAEDPSAWTLTDF